MATPLMSLPDQSTGKAKYVVPWKSRKEFLKIYQDIFGADERLKQSAVRRITTWKSRAGSKLSVAVANTGALFESILIHKIALREDQVQARESILRSSYSLAIVRFLNLVTEKGQNKQTAQPVHLLASEYGIPEWIVRVRHDATHNTLPSLDMLATAATWAIQYLKEEFWDRQTHDEDSTVGRKSGVKNIDSKLRGRMRQTLFRFRKLRFKELESDEIQQSTTAGEVLQLKDYMKGNRFCFMKCLLEDNILIPTAEELEKFGITKEDIMSQTSPHLPNHLQEFWYPVVIMLCNTRVIGMLAKVAMFSLTDEDCLRNHLLAGWLAYLLNNNTGSTKGNDCHRNMRVRGLMFDKSLLPKKLLLSVCLENVNKFTINLIKFLMDRDELGEEAFLKLSDLLKYTPPSVVYSHDSVDHEEEEEEEEERELEENVYTVEDVKEASFSVHEKEPSSYPVLESIQASVGSEEIGWKVCTDLINWSKVPLGIVASCIDEGSDEKNEEEEEEDDSEMENKKDNDNDDYEDEEDDDDEKEERGVRDWKRSQRKRCLKDDSMGVESSASPKHSTMYIVKDTELL